MISTTRHPFTFRELLSVTPTAEIIAALIAKDPETVPAAYLGAIDELLRLPPSTPGLPILLSYWVQDTEEDWISIHLLNTAYVQPPAGLTPAMGLCGKPVPEGHYDAEDTRYVETFGFGDTPWRELIDAEIRFEDESSVRRLAPTDAAIAAEILWELTFYGYSDAVREGVWSGIIAARDACLASEDTLQ